MTVEDVLKILPAEIVSGRNKTSKVVTGGFSADLLSHVMSKTKSGNVWVTMQAHPNIVAVASLMDLSAIIVTSGIKPDLDTINKACQEDIVLLTTSLSTFEVCGKLYSTGIY